MKKGKWLNNIIHVIQCMAMEAVVILLACEFET